MDKHPCVGPQDGLAVDGQFDISDIPARVTKYQVPGRRPWWLEASFKRCLDAPLTEHDPRKKIAGKTGSPTVGDEEIAVDRQPCIVETDV
jgi:hypothetical protein